MKYEALFCQLRDVNNIPRFLNAECRFFSFFFLEGGNRQKKTKLNGETLKTIHELD